MSFWKRVSSWLGYVEVRAKDAKGRFVADDKSTPDVDESKKMVRKKRTTKKKKPAAKKRASKKTKK